ncbi:MAG: hypothetical protein LBR07_00125, partial [Puniceicoccales bacterium]|nr:hypothetical protein [Puniceicoccales bacterium]
MGNRQFAPAASPRPRPSPAPHPATRFARAFHTVEKNHANTLQTIRGAWPDWWTDGFGTGQREAAALRKTSAAATAAQTALA